ncbi:MAG: hypothetical protein A2283_01605 [Lentisphaerae bacterium RIFOXYA12_FULL_48_11]|nr:MAG: hypothetical protein A2283_01605 [Lentisphaerae bacterium RIFOXYA12_FULL_48_11]
MSVKKILLQCILLCLASYAIGATNDLWFPVGEKLIYRLYWGIIPVGTCEMSTQWIEVEGKRLLSIRAIARTTSVVSKIYPVDDYVETQVNPETFLPVEYIQKLREGRHIRDDIVKFNHKEGIAVWKSAKARAAKVTKEIKIETDTRDVLCLAYYMRSKGLAVGQEEKFKVIVDDKIYDLQVKGLGYETMDVDDFEDVKCLVVEPTAAFGGIFVRKGRVTLWFSEDMRRICTRMTGKLSVANLKAVLMNVDGPGDDIWSGKFTKTAKTASRLNEDNT